MGAPSSLCKNNTHGLTFRLAVLQSSSAGLRQAGGILPRCQHCHQEQPTSLQCIRSCCPSQKWLSIPSVTWLYQGQRLQFRSRGEMCSVRLLLDPETAVNNKDPKGWATIASGSSALCKVLLQPQWMSISYRAPTISSTAQHYRKEAVLVPSPVLALCVVSKTALMSGS